MEEKQTSKKGISYPNRMLRALEGIFTSDEASIEEKLQALRLSAEVLPFRRMPRRKTDKEKMVIAALEKNNPKKREYFKKKEDEEVV